MCDLPSGNNWNFDARWSPKLPAILATASFDGSVNVYSLTDTGSGTSGGAKQVLNVYRMYSLEYVQVLNVYRMYSLEYVLYRI
jgi:hypothetical protein